MTLPHAHRPPSQSTASAEGVRLAKQVAAQVPCSRSEAEKYIEGGWVRVNGKVVEEAQFRVLGNHKVVIDPNASLLNVTQVTLLMHKPPGYSDGVGDDENQGSPASRGGSARQLLTPANRAPGDASGIPGLKRHLNDLTAPVPLEMGAGGLLVFTQDWRVARKLIEDAGTIEHEIIVEIEGEMAPETLLRLNQGLSSDGHPLPRVKVSVNSASEGKSKLRFAVKGSHPGLLAYLCERVGLRILSMKRIRVGRVLLTTLPMGQWRYLLPHERF
jgi:23S rRNA pseudouridine2604 synthase